MNDMARVYAPNAVFKVVLTEYERGWGQKHFDTWYFDNEAEARKAAIDYNLEHNNKDYVPDWYVRAEYVGRT
jgi:hypothetical protein